MKDRNLHPSCKIYVGETVRNMQIRWDEHNNINKKTEPSKHLFLNVRHSFNRSVLSFVHKNTRTRKNLEAFFIAKMKRSLNEQAELNVLNLFRNGFT